MGVEIKVRPSVYKKSFWSVALQEFKLCPKICHRESHRESALTKTKQVSKTHFQQINLLNDVVYLQFDKVQHEKLSMEKGSDLHDLTLGVPSLAGLHPTLHRSINFCCMQPSSGTKYEFLSTINTNFGCGCNDTVNHPRSLFTKFDNTLLSLH